MLTIFSVPKPFCGHIGIIQRNAIHSWSRLHPGCEIILCGDEPGTEEVAAEFKAKYIPIVARNEYGTPLLNSVFDQVGQMTSQDLMCYVNADIMLLSDFMEAVQRIRFRRFQMVGQRWDIDLTKLWNFERTDWEEQLRRYVLDHGVLHAPAGSDYFVFPRDSAIELPPFAVGRPGWDNWFIYKARKLGIPVVDVTRVVTVIHQNHSYSHVLDRRGEFWEGPEAERNRELMGDQDYTFTLLDATHVLMSRALLPALGREYARRRWQTLPVLVPSTRPLVRFVNMVRHRLRPQRPRISSQ
jgi:hypothetical protein